METRTEELILTPDRYASAPAAIVAFSFGKRRSDEEPNPSNSRLASVVIRELDKRKDNPLIVAQWEIAKGIRELGRHVDLVVDEARDGSYLSTDDVWSAATDFLAQQGVRQVVPVAQPFLHLPMIKRMVRKSGFALVSADIGAVPFDDSEKNLQWWTKGKARLTAYSVARAARSIAGKPLGWMIGGGPK